MNGGPATGGVPAGGAAPPYQGAGQQAKRFRGKGYREPIKSKLVTETGRNEASRKRKRRKK
jgi:hypothetical protein